MRQLKLTLFILLSALSTQAQTMKIKLKQVEPTSGPGKVIISNSLGVGEWQASPYLTVELDPIFTASPAYGWTINTFHAQGGNSFGAVATLGTNDNYGLDIRTNGVTRLSIASGGNVLIGSTTDQGGNLQVNSSVSGGVGAVLNLVNPNIAANTATEIRFSPTSSPTLRYAKIVGLNQGSNTTSLSFYPSSSGTFYENLRLTSSGTYLIDNVPDAAGDFLVRNVITSQITKRTPSEVLSDIGAAPATGGNYVDLTTNQIANGKKTWNSLQVNASLRERSYANTGTTTLALRKFEDVSHYANSVSTVNGNILIKLPINAATMWVAKIWIYQYGNATIATQTPVELIVSGYHTLNTRLSVWCNNPNMISQVRFGRNVANDATYLFIDNGNGLGYWQYPKVELKEFYVSHGSVNISVFEDPANYPITITTDESDFVLNATITNANFIRDSYYATAASLANYIPLTGSNSISGNLNMNFSNSHIGVASGYFKLFGNTSNSGGNGIGQNLYFDGTNWVHNNVAGYSGTGTALELSSGTNAFVFKKASGGTTPATVTDIAWITNTGLLYVNGGNSNQWNAAYSWGNHAGLYVSLDNNLAANASKAFGVKQGNGFFVNTTGSTNYPSVTGFSVEFSSGLGANNSSYNRDFTLFHTYNSRDFYLRGYANVTGASNGFNRIWHDGDFSATDISHWNTAYTNRISSLTTTGSSGAATLVSNVLNIPNYTLAGLGGQPSLSGTGIVKSTGGTISYLTDNSTNWNVAYNLGLVIKGTIPNADDLNNYTSTGVWIQNTNSQAASGTNYPVPLAGKLEVVAYGTQEIWQTYHTYGYTGASSDRNVIWKRAYYTGLGWSAWSQIWDNVNITATNVTNWNTAYTNRITSLTTTGSSGAATLSANVLNIPNYTLAGLGGIPTTHTVNNITNGTGFLKNNGTGTWSYDNSTYLTTSSAASTYIPLAGSSAITGSLIPSVTSTIDLGSSTKKWNTIYTTDLQSGGGTFAGTLNTSNLVASNQITGDVVVGISGLSLGNATSNNQVAFKNTLLTANHNYELPNADGTLALTTNIPAQFNPSAGTGISLSGTYPNVTITALNSNPLWNANMLQGVGVSTTTPTNGQVLQLVAGIWSPINAPWLTSYTETDPIANAKTVTLTQGTGITITGASQTVGSNPSFTITAQNTTAQWNANQLNGFVIQAGTPTSNDVLQFKSGQWQHVQPTWITAANLTLGTATTTTIPINIDAGTDVTLPSVTTTAAGLMSASDKVKLNGIATGAEVNVQADMNQSNSSLDDFVKNKPWEYDANNYVQPTTGSGVMTRGAFGTNLVQMTGSYTVDVTDHDLIDKGVTAITLPNPTSSQFRELRIRIKSGNSVSLNYTIANGLGSNLTAFEPTSDCTASCSGGITYIIESDGGDWYLMGLML